MIDLQKEIANTFEILNQTESQLDVELIVPATWSYFVGHFPQGPLLPAVAIVDVSQFFIGKHLSIVGAPISLRRLSNFRIKNPVQPGCKVLIQVERDKTSADGEIDFNILWKSAAENKLFAELSLRVAAL